MVINKDVMLYTKSIYITINSNFPSFILAKYAFIPSKKLQHLMYPIYFEKQFTVKK